MDLRLLGMLALALGPAATGPVKRSALERADDECATAEKLLSDGKGGDARRLLDGALARCRAARDAVCESRVRVAMADAAGRAGGEAAHQAAAECARALPVLRAAGSRSGEQAALRCIGRDPTSRQAAPLPPMRLAAPRPAQRLALPQARAVASRPATPATTVDRRRNLPALEQQLAAARRLPANKLGEAAAHEELGHAHVAVGNRDRAIRSYDASLALKRTAGDRDGEARVLIAKSAVQAQAGNKAAARTNLVRAAPLYRSVGDPVGESRALGDMAKVAVSPRAAVFLGKQAAAAYERGRTDVKKLDPATQHVFARSAARTYRKLSEDLVKQGRFAEAQQALALLKARELDSVLPGGPERAPAQPLSLTAKEGRDRARLEQILNRVARLEQRAGPLRAKPVRTAAEDGELRGLEQEIEAGHSEEEALLESAGQGEGDDKLRDQAAIATTLADLPGAVAVFTIVGQDRLLTFLVTPDGQKLYQSNLTSAQILERVRALRAALEQPGTDLAVVKQASRALYDALVAPLENDLAEARATTIAWWLDGALRYVPMAALWDGSRWLVERYGNVVITQASLTRLLHVPAGDWSVLALGVTKAHEPLPALPSVATELSMVVRQDPTDPGVFDGVKLVDEAFTKEAMLQELKLHRKVLHVASHYLLRTVGANGEDASALLLGDGGELKLTEVDQIPMRDFRLELVVLSACDTALEGDDPSAAGAEVDSLAEVAQWRGAQAVLASLWEVADASTAALMRQFYQRRMEFTDETKAEALRQAQLAMLQGRFAPSPPPDETPVTGPGEPPATPQDATPAPQTGAGRGAQIEGGEAGPAGWSHPFYWAPFVLIGNWR